MQVTVPPVTFLFSALHYLLYGSHVDGNYEIDGYLNRKPITSIRATYVFADTVQGRVRGTLELSRTRSPYYLFRGIPYAKPPVGNLRYEPPEAHDNWEGVLDATYFRSQCLQINVFTRTVVGNEDCLFLNVATKKTYLHDDLPESNEGLKPVFVFVHGGLFMFGGANPFGSKYFMDEDVVLVTLNYRLNSFGFFNTADGVVSGNMGLKDQTQVLIWVQENIKYFNGDSRRVTLIGESAGAVCVHLHTLSPLSNGLYSSAISLSGTALSPWGHVDYPDIQAKEFGEGLGCPTEDSREMVNCIKALDSKTVARYHLGYIHAASQGKQALFGPTVDSGTGTKKFLRGKPLNLLRAGRISDKPWISGVNSGDGLVYLIPILRNDTMREMVASNWETFAPALLAYQNHSDSSTLTTRVSSFYLHNSSGITHDYVNDTGCMFSDRGFFLDGHDVAVMQSQVAPTYLYYYNYNGVFAMANLLFYRTPLPIPNDWNYMLGGGIVWLASMMLNRRQKRRLEIFHGDEMPLLFNIPLIRREVGRTDSDYEFSRKMVGLFVSFAETGVPDPHKVGENVTWQSVQRSKRNGMDGPLQRLNLDKSFSIIDEPFYDRMQFWKSHSINYLQQGRRRRKHKSRPKRITK